ncbi:MAG: RcnB family protein [Sphingomonas sp.]|nr:RcnB family protein [Sphingomonas sp.]
MATGLATQPAQAQRPGAPYPIPAANPQWGTAPLPGAQLPPAPQWQGQAPQWTPPIAQQQIPGPPPRPNWNGQPPQTGWGGPPPQAGWHGQPQPGWAGQPNTGWGWGEQIDGRWAGGARAPGGWNAYRRPTRGWRLPSYWNQDSFIITNYSGFGLGVPPVGYHWSRYYDDAVLVDGRGRVVDFAQGIDWNRYDGGYDYGYAQAGVGTPYSGTYSGTYANGYGWQGSYQGQYVAPPAVTYQPQPVVQPLPPQGIVNTYGAGAYASGVTVNGQFFPTAPGSATTVTVASAAPVVTTTTTTEYVYETRSVARRVWRKPVRKWRPAPKRTCACGCCH